MAVAPTTPESAAAMTPLQRGTLVATGLGLFMIFLDALIVNVALPHIQRSFHAGESGLQWMVTAYSLAMAVSMMSAATLADRFGRRRVYTWGLAVFTLASVACGLAPSIVVMDVARGVQGLGAAAVNVTSLALVSAAFTEPAAKARAIGLWSAIAATGVALGPTLGGLLTHGIGWRSVFFVNVAFGGAAIVLTRRYVDESRDPVDRSPDLPGQVLYVVAVGGFAYAVIEGPHLGWLHVSVVIAAIALVAGLWWFVRHELRAPEPMMDLRLFASRAYTLAIVTVFTVLFSVYGMLLVISQLWQNVMGYSVLRTGMLLLPLALVEVALSPLAGRWVGRVGARRVVLVGMGLLVVSFVVQIIGISVSPTLTVIGVCIVGAGQAITITPATSVAMSSVPESRAGMASGIMSSQRALGSTAGYAVLGSVLAAWLGLSLGPSLRPAVPDRQERHEIRSEIIDDANPRALSAEIGPATGPVGPDAATTGEVTAVAEEEFRHAIQVALAVAALVSLVVLLIDWRGIPSDAPRATDEGAGPDP